MPHVTVEHFPADLTDEQKRRLAAELTEIIVWRFGTYPGAVSIALEPVAPEDWRSQVYEPRIVGRADRLIKAPEYRA